MKSLIKTLIQVLIVLYLYSYFNSERSICVRVKKVVFLRYSVKVYTNRGIFDCNAEYLMLDFSSVKRRNTLVEGEYYNIKTIGVFSENIINVKHVNNFDYETK